MDQATGPEAFIENGFSFLEYRPYHLWIIGVLEMALSPAHTNRPMHGMIRKSINFYKGYAPFDNPKGNA